jgi:hypothetical protein
MHCVGAANLVWRVPILERALGAVFTFVKGARDRAGVLSMAYLSEAALERKVDWQCPTCRLASRAREGMVSLPNNPLIVAAIQALCAGGPLTRSLDSGWRRSKSAMPVYEFWNGAGGRIRVGVDAADEASAWREIESYSALTLDVAVALLAALVSDPFRQSTCAPRREPVALGAAAVLNAKNYRRFGSERAAFAAAVDAERAKIERLRFDLVAYPGFDPQSRKWRHEGITRAGIALLETQPCEMMEPIAANDRTACAHERTLRLGAWAEHWLNSAGAMWIAPLPQAILHLDHRENRSADGLAKKVALILTLSFAAARDTQTLRMPMRALLRRTGLLPRLNANHPAHSGRIADRVEEALLRLAEKGLLKSATRSESALVLRASHRRWFDEWLDAEVVFERPSAIAARSA